MDVASLSRVNQIYSSSLRLFANALTTQQQLDSKLIAFCTILTVAVSVLLLSFKQSRLILLNATHVTTCYPYLYTNVKKCFKVCLKQLKVVKLSSVKSATSSTLALSRTYTSFYYNAASSKYLKLKRLQSNIAAASLAVTKSTCTNLLFKPLNKTFSTMRKTTNKLRVKNIISIKSKIVNGKTPKSFLSASSKSLQCDAEKRVVIGSKSYPMFEPSRIENVNTDENNLRRSETWPKINSSKVKLYRKLPLRSMSRAWGEINSIDLPVWCRKPCFYFYSWVFNCNLDEIDIQDLNEYKNLSEFFRRALKPDARVIDTSTNLVSPCDGKILNFGRVDKGYLEQVKGVNYSLEAFLGEQNWPKNIYSTDDNNNKNSLGSNETNGEFYEKSILYNPDNCLYHCVIYLAPGDYHRFHSPADWQVFYRRHFPGELFSVNPSVARWLHGLFNFNERVVYYGQWEHGFFSMTAVGATNVGSIKVYEDEGLATNTKMKNLEIENLDRNFCQKNFTSGENINLKGLDYQKGDNFGEFNLGSTIVLIFEAPKNFEFQVNQRDKVLLGCSLGSI